MSKKSKDLEIGLPTRPPSSFVRRKQYLDRQLAFAEQKVARNEFLATGRMAQGTNIKSFLSRETPPPMLHPDLPAKTLEKFEAPVPPLRLPQKRPARTYQDRTFRSKLINEPRQMDQNYSDGNVYLNQTSNISGAVVDPPVPLLSSHTAHELQRLSATARAGLDTFTKEDFTPRTNTDSLVQTARELHSNRYDFIREELQERLPKFQGIHIPLDFFYEHSKFIIGPNEKKAFQGLRTTAFARYFDGDKWYWKECSVEYYDNENRKFTIKMDEFTKKVSRFSLLFDGQSNEELNVIKEELEKIRDEIEQDYIKGQYLSHLHLKHPIDIPQKFLMSLADRIGILPEDVLDHGINECFSVALHRNALFKPNEIVQSPDYIVFSDFEKVSNRINSSFYFKTVAHQRFFKKLFNTCENIKNSLIFDFRQQLPFDLWLGLQYRKLIELSKYLRDVWTKELVDVLPLCYNEEWAKPEELAPKSERERFYQLVRFIRMEAITVLYAALVDHLIGLLRSSPLFVLEVLFDNKSPSGFSISPSVSEIDHKFKQFLDDIYQSLSFINGIMPTHDLLVFEQNNETQEVFEIVERAVAEVEEMMVEPTKDYSELFLAYHKIDIFKITSDVLKDVSRFSAKNIDALDLSFFVSHDQDPIKRVFSVSVSNFKALVSEASDKVVSSLVQHEVTHCYGIFCQLKDKFTEADEYIAMEPKDPQELQKRAMFIDNALSDLPQQYSFLCETFEVFLQLELFKSIKDEYWKLFFELFAWPKRIEQSNRSRISHIRQLRENFNTQLQEWRKDFDDQFLALQAKINDIVVVYHQDSLDDNKRELSILRPLKEEYDELFEFSQRITKNEGLLKRRATDFSRLFDLPSEFIPLVNLFEIGVNWQLNYFDWNFSSFLTLNIDDITNKIDGYLDQLGELRNEVFFANSKNLGHSRMLDKLKSDILNFNQLAPVIRYLRCPVLRTRHWISIDDIFDKDIRSFLSGSLSSILDQVNIVEELDAVGKIVNRAKRENLIQTVIDQCKFTLESLLWEFEVDNTSQTMIFSEKSFKKLRDVLHHSFEQLEQFSDTHLDDPMILIKFCSWLNVLHIVCITLQKFQTLFIGIKSIAQAFPKQVATKQFHMMYRKLADSFHKYVKEKYLEKKIVLVVASSNWRQSTSYLLNTARELTPKFIHFLDEQTLNLSVNLFLNRVSLLSYIDRLLLYGFKDMHSSAFTNKMLMLYPYLAHLQFISETANDRIYVRISTKMGETFLVPFPECSIFEFPIKIQDSLSEKIRYFTCKACADFNYEKNIIDWFCSFPQQAIIVAIFCTFTRDLDYLLHDFTKLNNIKKRYMAAYSKLYDEVQNSSLHLLKKANEMVHDDVSVIDNENRLRHVASSVLIVLEYCVGVLAKFISLDDFGSRINYYNQVIKLRLLTPTIPKELPDWDVRAAIEPPAFILPALPQFREKEVGALVIEHSTLSIKIQPNYSSNFSFLPLTHERTSLIRGLVLAFAQRCPIQVSDVFSLIPMLGLFRCFIGINLRMFVCRPNTTFKEIFDAIYCSALSGSIVSFSGVRSLSSSCVLEFNSLLHDIDVAIRGGKETVVYDNTVIPLHTPFLVLLCADTRLTFSSGVNVAASPLKEDDFVAIFRSYGSPNHKIIGSRLYALSTIAVTIVKPDLRIYPYHRIIHCALHTAVERSVQFGCEDLTNYEFSTILTHFRNQILYKLPKESHSFLIRLAQSFFNKVRPKNFVRDTMEVAIRNVMALDTTLSTEIAQGIRNIHQLFQEQHICMLLGDSGSGKSTLVDAYVQFCSKYHALKNNIEADEICITKYMRINGDGFADDLHSFISNIVVDDPDKMYILAIEGDVMKSWFSPFLQLVTDPLLFVNSKMSHKNAIKVLPSNFKIIIEVADHLKLTPRLISAIPTLHVACSPSIPRYIEKKAKLLNIDEIYQTHISTVLSSMLPSLLELSTHGSISLAPINSVFALISSFLTHIKQFIASRPDLETEFGNRQALNNIDHAIVFSTIWGLGSALSSRDRDRLATQTKSAILRKRPHFKIKIPFGQSLYDLFLDVSNSDPVWMEFSEVSASSLIGHDSTHQLYPTLKVLRTANLVQLLTNAGMSMLIDGPVGIGKTIIAKRTLNEMKKKNDRFDSHHIGVFKNITVDDIRSNFFKPLMRRGSSRYGAKYGSQVAYLISRVRDTRNISTIENMLSFLVDGMCIVDNEFVTLNNTSLVLTASNAYGSDMIGNRLRNRVFHLSCDDYPVEQYHEIIMKLFENSSIADFFGRMIDTYAGSIANLFVELRNKIPSSSGYLGMSLNFTHLGHMVEAICKIPIKRISGIVDFVKLVFHESCRIFSDALLPEDKSIVKKAFSQSFMVDFDVLASDVVPNSLSEQTFFSPLVEIDDARCYFKCEDPTRHVIKAFEENKCDVSPAIQAGYGSRHILPIIRLLTLKNSHIIIANGHCFKLAHTVLEQASLLLGHKYHNLSSLAFDEFTASCVELIFDLVFEQTHRKATILLPHINTEISMFIQALISPGYDHVLIKFFDPVAILRRCASVFNVEQDLPIAINRFRKHIRENIHFVFIQFDQSSFLKAFDHCSSVLTNFQRVIFEEPSVFDIEEYVRVWLCKLLGEDVYDDVTIPDNLVKKFRIESNIDDDTLLSTIAELLVKIAKNSQYAITNTSIERFVLNLVNHFVKLSGSEHKRISKLTRAKTVLEEIEDLAGSSDNDRQRLESGIESGSLRVSSLNSRYKVLAGEVEKLAKMIQSDSDDIALRYSETSKVNTDIAAQVKYHKGEYDEALDTLRELNGIELLDSIGEVEIPPPRIIIVARVIVAILREDIDGEDQQFWDTFKTHHLEKFDSVKQQLLAIHIDDLDENFVQRMTPVIDHVDCTVTSISRVSTSWSQVARFIHCLNGYLNAYIMSVEEQGRINTIEAEKDAELKALSEKKVELEGKRKELKDVRDNYAQATKHVETLENKLQTLDTLSRQVSELSQILLAESARWHLYLKQANTSYTNAFVDSLAMALFGEILSVGSDESLNFEVLEVFKSIMKRYNMKFTRTTLATTLIRLQNERSGAYRLITQRHSTYLINRIEFLKQFTGLTAINSSNQECSYVMNECFDDYHTFEFNSNLFDELITVISSPTVVVIHNMPCTDLHLQDKAMLRTFQTLSRLFTAFADLKHNELTETLAKCLDTDGVPQLEIDDSAGTIYQISTPGGEIEIHSMCCIFIVLDETVSFNVNTLADIDLFFSPNHRINLFPDFNELSMKLDSIYFEKLNDPSIGNYRNLIQQLYEQSLEEQRLEEEILDVLSLEDVSVDKLAHPDVLDQLRTLKISYAELKSQLTKFESAFESALAQRQSIMEIGPCLLHIIQKTSSVCNMNFNPAKIVILFDEACNKIKKEVVSQLKNPKDGRRSSVFALKSVKHDMSSLMAQMNGLGNEDASNDPALDFVAIRRKVALTFTKKFLKNGVLPLLPEQDRLSTCLSIALIIAYHTQIVGKEVLYSLLRFLNIEFEFDFCLPNVMERSILCESFIPWHANDFNKAPLDHSSDDEEGPSNAVITDVPDQNLPSFINTEAFYAFVDIINAGADSSYVTIFRSLINKTQHGMWQEWYEHGMYLKLELPSELGLSLKPFDRLIIIQTLVKDCGVSVLVHFIHQLFGIRPFSISKPSTNGYVTLRIGPWPEHDIRPHCRFIKIDRHPVYVVSHEKRQALHNCLTSNASVTILTNPTIGVSVLHLLHHYHQCGKLNADVVVCSSSIPNIAVTLRCNINVYHHQNVHYIEQALTQHIITYRNLIDKAFDNTQLELLHRQFVYACLMIDAYFRTLKTYNPVFRFTLPPSALRHGVFQVSRYISLRDISDIAVETAAALFIEPYVLCNPDFAKFFSDKTIKFFTLLNNPQSVTSLTQSPFKSAVKKHFSSPSGMLTLVDLENLCCCLELSFEYTSYVIAKSKKMYQSTWGAVGVNRLIASPSDASLFSANVTVPVASQLDYIKKYTIDRLEDMLQEIPTFELSRDKLEKLDVLQPAIRYVIGMHSQLRKGISIIELDITLLIDCLKTHTVPLGIAREKLRRIMQDYVPKSWTKKLPFGVISITKFFSMMRSYVSFMQSILGTNLLLDSKQIPVKGILHPNYVKNVIEVQFAYTLERSIDEFVIIASIDPECPDAETHDVYHPVFYGCTCNAAHMNAQGFLVPSQPNEYYSSLPPLYTFPVLRENLNENYVPITFHYGLAYEHRFELFVKASPGFFANNHVPIFIDVAPNRLYDKIQENI
ncbi:hypothetical protein PCE1_004329 [Barthelona sp. PCE]